MKKLEEFIESAAQSISNFEDNFYKDVVSLHQNEKLRKLAQLGGGFWITNTNSDPCLYYDKRGFVLCKNKYDDEGSFSGNSESGFKVKEKKLYAKYYSKNTEMLEIFPKLTIQQIADTIESGIRKIDFYRKAVVQKLKDDEAKKALDKMLEVGK